MATPSRESNLKEVARDAWRRLMRDLADGAGAAELSEKYLGLHLSAAHVEQLRPAAAEATRLAQDVQSAAERLTRARAGAGGPVGMNRAAAAAMREQLAGARRAAARLEELRAAHPDLIGDLASAAVKRLG